MTAPVTLSLHTSWCHRDKQAAAATGRFQSAAMAGEDDRRAPGTESHRRLEHIFHYHQGSAWFAAAGEGAPEKRLPVMKIHERRSGQPDDLDAINYELILARLEEARQSSRDREDAGEKRREGKREGETWDQDWIAKTVTGKTGERTARAKRSKARKTPGATDGQEQEEEAGQPAEHRR